MSTDRAVLDEAVHRVSSSLETQFRAKVGMVQLISSFGDFPVGCCTHLGDSANGDAALRLFFLDAARQIVCGLQDMLLDDEEED